MFGKNSTLSSILIGLILVLTSSISNATIYYFSSTTGSDTRSSLEAQNPQTPWKSIQKLNSIFPNLHPGDQVLFKSGEKFLGEIILSKSGNSGSPISFGIYGGTEKAILTTFSKITNWISKGGNIYEADVPILNGRVNVVAVDNTAYAMGRYPNSNTVNAGYLTMSSASNGSVSSNEMQAPTNFSAGEIVIRKNNWVIDRHYINSHSGTTVNYNTTGSGYQPRVGYGFFIQNHPGTLDQFGEWYYDGHNKKIRFYYDKGEPSGGDIQVATSNNVLNFQQNISHIHFNNISFQGANDNTVQLRSSANIRFDKCEITFSGGSAIHGAGIVDLQVENSLIQDAYNGGIHQQWNDRGLVVRNSTFNRIYNFAGMGKNADLNGNGIYMSETSSNATIEFSKFTNMGYIGINFNGNNTIVKNNLIDTFCFVKDDGAGIYTFTGSANTDFTGRKVVDNIVINGIGAVPGTKPYGPNDFPYVEGIYMDDNTSGVEIRRNTVANITSSGIYLHNARNISITENRIYNTGYSLQFVHDNLGDPIRNLTVTNNEYLGKNEKQCHVFVRSKLDDTAQMGVFDNNVVSRPVNDYNTIYVQTPSNNGLIDLQNWNDRYGLDKNTKRSPVTYDKDKMDIEEFILFEYNNSNSAKSISLSGGAYVDLKGNHYNGGISIPSYSSVLLLKTESLVNAPSSVSILNPQENASYYNEESITINTDAKDEDGTIAKVEFYNGNTLLGTDTTSSHSFTWSNPPVGSITLTAKATDNKGAVSVSAAVNISVTEKPNVVPTVSITSPMDGDQFIQGDTVGITATAADSEGTIAKVEFYNGNTLLGTDTILPQGFTWADLPVGSFALTARATDNKGATTVSETVHINVAEKANAAPNVRIKSPLDNDQLIRGEMIIVKADAEDTDGTIAKVEFYSGNTLLGTDTTLPHRFYWTDLPVGSFALTAKATDNKGASTVSETVHINVAEKANAAPNVRIKSPLDNDQLIRGDMIIVKAVAEDTDGTIAKGEFYSGNTLLGTDTTLPHRFYWSDLAVGSFALTAKATDDKGAVMVSEAVNISIEEKERSAPTVKIITPKTNMEFFRYEDLKIEVQIETPDSEVVKVEYFRNNVFIGSNYNPPFDFSWKAVNLGNMNLRAVVTDNFGIKASSEKISIRVKNNSAPSILISSPVNNDEFLFGTNIDIEVNTSDSDGSVAKVEFYYGNHFIGQSTNEPFNFTWKDVQEGKHTLTAIATDKRGATTVSPSVDIIVGEKEGPQEVPVAVVPEVIIVTPATNEEYEEEDDINVVVMFQGSEETVQKVDYYSGNQLIGTSSSSPFSFNWKNATVGMHTLTAKALGEDPLKIKNSDEVTIVVKEKIQSIFQIVQPIKDAVFNSGSDIIIKVDIPESSKTIDKIEYFRGNSKIGISTAAPYNFTWKKAQQGTHSVKARLMYSDGSELLSFSVKITVLRRDQTRVRLLTAEDKPVVLSGENIELNVDLLKFETEVEVVEYLINDIPLGNAIDKPFGYHWKDIPAGEHKLVARALDSNGVSYYSDPIIFKAVNETQDIQLDYAIGPNPTTEYLNVIFKNLDGIYDFEIKIVSMNGQVQKTFAVRPEESKITLDVSALKNGLYIIHLMGNGNNLASKKFIKK